TDYCGARANRCGSHYRPPAPPHSSRRRLAAQVQGLASRSTTESPGKRPSIPQATTRPASSAAAAAAALQRIVAAKAENHSAAHGNLGAPDRRAEKGRQDSFHQDPPVAARTAQADGRRHSRPAQNGPAAAPAGAGLLRVPQQVL